MAGRVLSRPAPIVALLAAALVALAGCGGAAQQGTSTVAKAEAAPALPSSSAERSPEDAVPASHAVEPVVGEDATGGSTTIDPADGTAGGKVEGSEAEPSGSASAAPRPSRSAAILSAADRASFASLTSSLGSRSGIAVSGLGLGRRVERDVSLTTAVAWSTAKVPVAMAVIASGAGAQTNLTAAITASDNAAALRLWSSLGGGESAAGAADKQLRAAGDKRTQIESRSLRGGAYTPFGQTAWALADQARFTAGMACTQNGAQVLGLMGHVVAGQRWGLGSAGVPPQFKGGWGPGSQPGAGGGYLDRQMGVLTIHGKPVAVAIATQPSDGSHNSGTRNLTAIARWLVGHADVESLPRRAANC